MAFDQSGDATGEIGRKYGNTVISTLRSIYGASFAPDCQPTDMLSDVLAELDEPSLACLHGDYAAGRLEEKLAEKS